MEIRWNRIGTHTRIVAVGSRRVVYKTDTGKIRFYLFQILDVRAFVLDA